jgi:MFS family permease
MLGSVMVCAGLALSSSGEAWQLYVGHGLLIGLLGNAAINAPLYVYVTRWFERRRGTALALIASGQYVAGASWPPLFERAIAAYGWRQTMLGFGFVVVALVVPLAMVFLRTAPEPPKSTNLPSSDGQAGKVLGLHPNATFGLLAGASFLCCVPMAMPSSHLIALCGDLGLAPARGAAMLTVLLACAFLSRQFWGWISDRIGGLRTVLTGSLFQIIAMTAFLLTQDEVGLFTVAAGFGLGFAGIIPAYVLAIREHFPANEASWRIPTFLLCSGAGMAIGGWLAGALYDYFGFYGPAFAAGVVANAINLLIVGALVFRQSSWRRALP